MSVCPTTVSIKLKKFLKLYRFTRIYGPVRTWFKLAGRARARLGILRPLIIPHAANVGVIGCGQFAFATIGYCIGRGYVTPFVDCFDIESDKQVSFADFYRISVSSSTALDLISNSRVKYVYIASNHASHATYAVQSLEAGKTVYIEKPVAVTYEQLACLLAAIKKSSGKVYAGYNRPFSPAVKILKSHVMRRASRDHYQPVTLNCFISGHLIAETHWYRRPSEGSRICGNVGHWLDLAVHLLEWEFLADSWNIRLSFSNNETRDDDLSIAMTSANKDLINIVLTSRSEPFEGINETINFQKGDIICKIDDFRSMTLWEGPRISKYRFWPKDVGHNAALRQPFQKKLCREWDEVVKSTLLMLFIADMVRSGVECAKFSFESDFANLMYYESDDATI